MVQGGEQEVMTRPTVACEGAVLVWSKEGVK